MSVGRPAFRWAAAGWPATSCSAASLPCKEAAAEAAGAAEAALAIAGWRRGQASAARQASEASETSVLRGQLECDIE